MKFQVVKFINIIKLNQLFSLELLLLVSEPWWRASQAWKLVFKLVQILFLSEGNGVDKPICLLISYLLVQKVITLFGLNADTLTLCEGHFFWFLISIK